MALNYHTRKLMADDDRLKSYLPSLYQLDQEAIDPPWSRKAWDQLVGCHRHALYLAESRESGLLGFCLMARNEGQVHLLKVAVRKDAQRQGLGKLLVTEALGDHLGQSSWQNCYLEVKDSNRGALALYQSLGFYKLHHAEKYYPCGAGAFKMMLGALTP